MEIEQLGKFYNTASQMQGIIALAITFALLPFILANVMYFTGSAEVPIGKSIVAFDLILIMLLMALGKLSKVLGSKAQKYKSELKKIIKEMPKKEMTIDDYVIIEKEEKIYSRFLTEEPQSYYVKIWMIDEQGHKSEKKVNARIINKNTSSKKKISWIELEKTYGPYRAGKYEMEIE